MPKVKADEFIDLVKRSGLVNSERLTEAVSDLSTSVSDSTVVGSSLVNAGLLTSWQNERLMQGRYRGFFLGKYKILERIGAGGMGCVYLAEHVIMKHRVAVKVLSKNLSSSSLVDRFHQEARAAATFNHPHLVRAFDVDQAGDLHYIVMEYVEGANLASIVMERGPLPFREAADYIRQAAEGLAHAHAGGLIHRDVKPANLLLDRQCVVKVLDLGLARVTDEAVASLTLAHDEKQIGTIDYLAPEQAADSHNVDGRADIYSLGCTLYFMLTGRPPFAEASITRRIILHQQSEPASITQFRPDAPPGLLAICKRMTAKSPDRRYQSMTEVSQALAGWLEAKPAMQTSRAAPKQKIVQPVEEELALATIDDDEPVHQRSPVPAISSSIRNGPLDSQTSPAPKPRPQHSNSLLDEALAELAAIPVEASPAFEAEPVVHSSISKSPAHRAAARKPAPVPADTNDDEYKVYPLWFLLLAGGLLASLLLLMGFSFIRSFSAPPAAEKGFLD